MYYVPLQKLLNIFLHFICITTNLPIQCCSKCKRFIKRKIIYQTSCTKDTHYENASYVEIIHNCTGKQHSTLAVCYLKCSTQPNYFVSRIGYVCPYSITKNKRKTKQQLRIMMKANYLKSKRLRNLKKYYSYKLQCSYSVVVLECSMQLNLILSKRS